MVGLHLCQPVTLHVSIELAGGTSNAHTMSGSPDRQNGDPWKVSQCAYSEQSLTVNASLEAISSRYQAPRGEEANYMNGIWQVEVCR